MNDTKAGDRTAYFLLGAAIGAVAALLLAPESGAKTRRRIRRTSEETGDYLMQASKDLVETCEDLYKHTGELAGDAAHELSKRYGELADQSKKLLDEAAAILRRAAR